MGQKNFQIEDLNEHALQYVEKQHFIYLQVLQTIKQEAAGVTVRVATMRCRCGWNRSLTRMHQCLYCKEWFCELCAEQHFGKTVEQYRAEQATG